jgi:hypothetical protein
VTKNASQQALKQLSIGLGLLGFCCGFLAAYSVLVGDTEGRVNLLFLLVLFAFLPFSGLLLSLLLLAKGGGKGLTGWILDIPLWPQHLTLALPQLSPVDGRELWFFYQTQILAMWFSAGCLILYLLLLLGSDITFVWRSTLLEPGDLLPVLQAIGIPWRFWPEAQASMTLIEQAQDFRLETHLASPPAVGLWWKYIFAAQLTYNLIPRSLMLVLARHKYRAHLQQRDAHLANAAQELTRKQIKDDFSLAELTASIALPYTLLDWAGAPATLHQQLQSQLGEADAIHRLSPLSQQLDAQLSENKSLVVLVKSWEPPMAELADKLKGIDTSKDKLILALDWNDTGMRQPTSAHLDEWRRFTATLPNWQVLKPEPAI